VGREEEGAERAAVRGKKKKDSRARGCMWADATLIN